MNVKIDELMVEQVMTASPTQSVGRARKVMNEHRIQSMPVVESDGTPVGIITSTDLLDTSADDRPVRELMTTKVYTVPRYSDPSLAARVMRNHRIHHVLVTHDGKLAGILSAFDLLRLVEDHRFTMKNAPTTGRAKGARRKSEG